MQKLITTILMETKQTAVEWLLDKITQNGEIRWRGTRYIELFEHAKAIEKEQMIKFALHLHNVDMSKTGTDILKDEAEQYYKITYEK